MALWQIDPARLQNQLEQVDAEILQLRLLQTQLQQYINTVPEKQVQLCRILRQIQDLEHSRRIVRQALEQLQDRTREISAAVQDDIQVVTSDVIRLF